MDPTLPKAPPRFSLPVMEPAWLRRLVRRQRVPLSDVDDVLQEVSLRVWQKWALVEAADEPGAYITEIAKQAARDYHRRSLRREPPPAAEDPSQAEGRGPTPEHHALIRQCCAIVGGLLDQIDDKARPLFVERAFDGDSVAEIAARHGLTERRVKALLELAWRDFEAAKKLIGGARAALLLGTPEGRVRAHLLLWERRERFPAGRLAREREELLSLLR